MDSNSLHRHLESPWCQRQWLERIGQYNGEEFTILKSTKCALLIELAVVIHFASGLIYGLVTGKSMADAAEFGVAASAIKHTIPGDLNHATLKEVEDLMKNDGSGRVQR